MKLVALAVPVVLAACQSNGGDFPLGTGGGGGVINNGGGGSGGGDDAGVDGGDGDAGLQLTGRVCVLTDLRKIGDAKACATTDADGLVVALGRSTATTGKDGSFVIAAPQGSGLTWHVSGGLNENAVVRSAMAFGTDNLIPALRAVRYEDLLRSNGAGLDDLSGSIVMRLVQGLKAVPALQLTTLDTELVFYDASNSDVWATTQTGSFGIVWLPDVLIPNPARAVSVSLTQQPQGTLVATPSVVVEDQTITFVTLDLPP
jgi:hypothetical protein